MAHYPTKLLLAVDGSPACKQAAEHAAEIASKSGSELHVIHVGLLSQWTNPDMISPDQYQRMKDDADKRLQGEVKEIEAKGITVTQSYLRMGRVDAEVIRLAEEIDAGLIVVGNRGIGALARILLGTDAESIVRHAPCPVLVVRKD